MPDAIETHRNSLSHNISLKMCLRLIPSFIFPGIVLITPTRRRLLSLAFSADCIRVCSWVSAFSLLAEIYPRSATLRQTFSTLPPTSSAFRVRRAFLCVGLTRSMSWTDWKNAKRRRKSMLSGRVVRCDSNFPWKISQFYWFSPSHRRSGVSLFPETFPDSVSFSDFWLDCCCGIGLIAGRLRLDWIPLPNRSKT